MSQKDFRKPEDIDTIEKLEEEVEKVLLLNDAGFVKMLVATVVANRMELDPVWLLLVAPSSGGKTELIQAVCGLDFMFPISDLTVNTFASGQKKTGKETSLLLKVNNGILIFKDFTSILAKNREARGEIMKQLREIYDGEYVKRTGTGDDVTWRGKIGAIAGCTEIVYRYLEDMSAMGDRFIMYNVQQPDRLEMSRRVLENASNMQEMRQHLRDCFTHYIKFVIEKMESEEEVKLDEKMKEEFLQVADFATRARSAVLTDFKTGHVDFVPAPEMPARMATQLYTLASAFVVMNQANPRLSKGHPAHENHLTGDEKRLIFKTAFDSVPRTRRNILFPLASYTGGVTTAGIATHLDLPSDSVKKYLYQVNALGICSRHKHGGKQGDKWKMGEKWRNIMKNIDNIKIEDSVLLGKEDDDEAFDEDAAFDEIDEYKKAKEELDTFDVDL